EHFDYEGLDGTLISEVGTRHMESIFFPIGANLLCLGIYVVALGLVTARRDILFRFATRGLLIVVCVEMFLAGLLNVIQLHLDVVISSRDSYLGYKERWEEAFALAKEGEESEFFRMEKLNYRKVNDPFMLDYRGLSGSTSTLNRKTIAFLDAMGYHSYSHLSCYNGMTPFTDSFFSIRYVAGESTDVFPARYEKLYDNGDVMMYKNPDALPVAFGVSPAVNGITFFDYEKDKDGNRIDPNDEREIHKEDSPFERMNALASALLGEEVTLFVPLTHRTSYTNVTFQRPGRYAAISRLKTASVSFTLQGVDGQEIYAYFPAYYPTEGCAKTVEYSLNGRELGTLFHGEESGYLSLGTYETGERCTVTFTLDEKPFYCGSPYFYALDDAVYRRLISTLSAGGYAVDECTEDFFSGSITVREGFETVLTSIPYDAGWRVTVDGEEVTTYETLDALLAFDLTPGEHTLTLRYLPREYVAALGISLLGTTALSLILLTELFLNRKKQRAAVAAGKDITVCTTISEEN
ncbi:MAG: YfhO family protein, partial [Clostridia bacterium]|nr:YfhO family protein [Clostridia bacterium]